MTPEIYLVASVTFCLISVYTVNCQHKSYVGFEGEVEDTLNGLLNIYNAIVDQFFRCVYVALLTRLLASRVGQLLSDGLAVACSARYQSWLLQRPWVLRAR